MGKNIVLCCDGTNNQFDSDRTNVLRTSLVVTRDARQCVYYHPGVGTMPSTGTAQWRDFALMGAQIFRIGVHLALPVIAALMVVNLAIGVMTRAAPQLNLMSFGFPMGLLAGLWMLWIAAPWMVMAIEGHIERSLSFLLR